VAEGVRLQFVVPAELADKVRLMAASQGVSVSRLGSSVLAKAVKRWSAGKA
jgi:F0F1-type ATP synthase alpha subunit